MTYTERYTVYRNKGIYVNPITMVIYGGRRTGGQTGDKNEWIYVKSRKDLQRLIITMFHELKNTINATLFIWDSTNRDAGSLWGIWDLSLASMFSFNRVALVASATMPFGGALKSMPQCRHSLSTNCNKNVNMKLPSVLLSFNYFG